VARKHKLELVEMYVRQANASVKSVNTGFSGTEQAAGKATWTVRKILL
jgi:hypothetical protein